MMWISRGCFFLTKKNFNTFRVPPENPAELKNGAPRLQRLRSCCVAWRFANPCGMVGVLGCACPRIRWDFLYTPGKTNILFMVQKSGEKTSWGTGSLSLYLRMFLYIQTVVGLGISKNHQQYPPQTQGVGRWVSGRCHALSSLSSPEVHLEGRGVSSDLVGAFYVGDGNFLPSYIHGWFHKVWNFRIPRTWLNHDDSWFLSGFWIWGLAQLFFSNFEAQHPCHGYHASSSSSQPEKKTKNLWRKRHRKSL